VSKLRNKVGIARFAIWQELLGHAILLQHSHEPIKPRGPK
jgi:hypothetical protein